MRENKIEALFRADATRRGGVGHVMRCLALAEAWTDGGGRASLMARTKDTLAATAVAAAGIDCLEMPTTTLEEDAHHVARQAVARRASWIVLDGYAFDADYEAFLKAECPESNIAVVNDSLRESRADLFVVPSSPLPSGSRIMPGPTTLVGGFDFAILRREYREAAPQPRSAPPARAHILIVLGGTDAAGLVAPVVEALLPAARTNGWRLQVIATEGILPENDEHLERIDPTPSIAAIMQKSDLVVCTASTVALEACACGLPQVLLVVAENQRAVAESLTTRGAALLASEAADVPGQVARALRADSYAQMSAQAAAMVDGQGARRVAVAMAAMDFALRRPTTADVSFTFHLGNDPEVRKASFQSDPIPRERHAAWFGQRMADENTWMRIAEDGRGTPFGFFRLQKCPTGEFVLSIALAATHRGLKLGARLVRQACIEFAAERPAQTIRAEVKPGNAPSERTFREAGFVQVSESVEKMVFQTQS